MTPWVTVRAARTAGTATATMPETNLSPPPGVLSLKETINTNTIKTAI